MVGTNTYFIVSHDIHKWIHGLMQELPYDTLGTIDNVIQYMLDTYKTDDALKDKDMVIRLIVSVCNSYLAEYDTQINEEYVHDYIIEQFFFEE